MTNFKHKCIAIFLFSSNLYAKNICHPFIHFWENQFIIGYGSLLNESSKKKTSLDVGPNRPIFLKNHQRVWNIHIHNKTYLGIKANQSHQLSAVFFPLPFHQVHRFDQREKFYCRISIATKDISPISNNKLLPKGQFWVYVPKIPSKSDINLNHIPAYYLKLYLEGCKKIAQDHRRPKYYQSCVEDLPKEVL
jgi:hypothetical protein